MAKMGVTALIPVRMGSTRFPGKPLALILGIPMIEHVRRRAVLSGLFDEVIVATCDGEIIDAVESFGGKAVMTKNTHERCTDRIEEAAHHVSSDIIVNIQGDEPVVLTETLEKLIAPLKKDPKLKVTNIVNPISSMEELSSLNVVKAVLSTTNKIIYMSRAAIPGNKYSNKVIYYKQTGLMAFRKDFLHFYSKLEPTPLENQESCDMLRIVEHDYQIQGIISDDKTIGVDIPEQIELAEKMILDNPKQKALFEQIKNAL